MLLVILHCSLVARSCATSNNLVQAVLRSTIDHVPCCAETAPEVSEDVWGMAASRKPLTLGTGELSWRFRGSAFAA